jgi:hypothetical protein
LVRRKKVKHLFSVLAGALVIAAFIPYIRAVWKGETQPAKASWVIWAVLDTITLIGMFAKDSVNGQIIGAVIGVWIVVVLALRYGTPGWTVLDKICLAIAAISIGLLILSPDPVLGLVCSLIGIFVGSIPTFRSVYDDPSRENKSAWVLFWLSCLAALAAVPAWTLQDAAQPIVFFVIESTTMWLLFKSRHKPQSLDHLNYHELRRVQLIEEVVDKRPSWQPRGDAEKQLERWYPRKK